MKKYIISILCLVFGQCLFAQTSFRLQAGHPITVACDTSESQVVQTALELLNRDCEAVFSSHIVSNSKKGDIIIGTVGKSPLLKTCGVDVSALKGKKQAFLLAVSPKGKLVVAGSDKHGTVYGILEISRLIGVSPWEWWADAVPEKKESFTLPADFKTLQSPSVEYRGIFINDEDWGLLPWASKNFEPELPTVGKTKGAIGPKTYGKIFELLLRLRANAIWPAMHECTTPFYLVDGNKEVADKYGIVVGTSHCEPLMRNSATEWDLEGKGDYNFLTNRDSVMEYWSARLKTLKSSENIFTIGMRGKHDGMMQGVKTLDEHKDALSQIIPAQRDLLKQYINPDIEAIPQVFVPYKEVLDVYNAGLNVPEDVTLMWCDDNYGYIKHFPDSVERARKGGNGIYYHISYWGRPHDYLWLATTSPALIYTQMKQAYDKGACKEWIVNVGDIKPAEYLTELFLDMAWDIHSIENSREGLNSHLYNWLNREFGTANAADLLPIMNEYYRLAYIRKPEYMGNTRTEESNPKYNKVSDFPWTETEITERIRDYQAIADKVNRLTPNIPAEKKNAWFQLIEYPVNGAAEMNKKHLYGQLARHGKADWSRSDSAYQTIVDLTEKYNSLGNGKWNYIMDFQPRRLPVYDKAPHTVAETPLLAEEKPLFLFNGTEFDTFSGEKPLSHGLGYQGKAISLPKGSAVTYSFDLASARDSIIVEVALAPFHPVEGSLIRYSISINGDNPQTVDYHTEGRSEEWKMNVLGNRATRKTFHSVQSRVLHTIKITALDEGVIVDQIIIE